MIDDKFKLKNRRLEVTYSKTVNLGNFESEKIQAGLSADISDLDNLEQAYQDMYNIVEEQVFKHLEEEE
jgi:hypothetical protein